MFAFVIIIIMSDVVPTLPRSVFKQISHGEKDNVKIVFDH